jgi:hypothetical protein
VKKYQRSEKVENRLPVYRFSVKRRNFFSKVDEETES